MNSGDNSIKRANPTFACPAPAQQHPFPPHKSAKFPSGPIFLPPNLLHTSPKGPQPTLAPILRQIFFSRGIFPKWRIFPRLNLSLKMRQATIKSPFPFVACPVTQQPPAEREEEGERRRGVAPKDFTYLYHRIIRLRHLIVAKHALLKLLFLDKDNLINILLATS